MSAIRIEFQAGMSLPQFMELYGREEKCEAPLSRFVGQRGLSVLDAGRKSMACFMDDAMSGINVDSVDIKRPSPPEQ